MAVQQVVEEKLITGEELYRMPERGRCELVDGRLVMKSPTGYGHSVIEMNVGWVLKTYADVHKSGKVGVGEVGIFIRRDPDTIRAAHVFFISNERYARRAAQGFLDIAPELVVEVLSPEDRWSEVMRKLADYFEAGVLLVWVVDPAMESIFAYRSLTGVKIFRAGDTVVEEEILPGFFIPVADIFKE